jgi:hypothetical protein
MLEDNNGVCSSELHRKFTGIYYNLSHSLRFQIHKVREQEYGKENSPVTLDWLQVHQTSHSRDEKQK